MLSLQFLSELNHLFVFSAFKTVIYDWIDARADTLIPLFIRGNWKIICKMNAQVESLLRNSIDSVASVVVILGLILFVILGSVFMFFQVRNTSKPSWKFQIRLWHKLRLRWTLCPAKSLVLGLKLVSF